MTSTVTERMISLFERYPTLANKLPYVNLGQFPTPIQKIDRLGKLLGVENLFIKRDDISGKIYGGNKIRKLEFLLGDAMKAGAREVLTFGAAGSNHALATAIYAKQLGIKSISMLGPQPNARYVRRNLLLSYHYGAELHQYYNIKPVKLLSALTVKYQLIRHYLSRGQVPKVIPVGGSSPLGTIGFVNAALELNDQISRKEMPEPDYIYVASGSMGTAAGLLIGLKVLASKSKVIIVDVGGARFVNTTRMLKLIKQTKALLAFLDQSFPRLEFTERDLDIRHSFAGKRYALFTRDGIAAVNLMKQYERITLEGTYTGKTLAALIDDSQKTDLKNKIVLFWNTYNSIDKANIIANIDYRKLPKFLHYYFEEEVQALDIE